MIFVKESYIIGWDSQNLFNVHNHTYIHTWSIAEWFSYLCTYVNTHLLLLLWQVILNCFLITWNGQQGHSGQHHTQQITQQILHHLITVVLLSPQHAVHVGICVLAPVLSAGWRSLPLPRLSSCLHPPVKTPSVLQQSPSRRASHSTLYLYNTYTFCVRDYVHMLQTIRNSESKTKQDSFSLRLMVQLAIPSNWEEVTASFSSTCACHLTHWPKCQTHIHTSFSSTCARLHMTQTLSIPWTLIL